MKENLEALLKTEDEQLRKLNEIVVNSIAEEKLISKKLFEFEDSNPTLKGRITDRMA